MSARAMDAGALSAGDLAPGSAWQRHRPLLLPALALWGWQEEVLPLALILALILELPRVVGARLEISQADFDRLWSFTSVLFLAVIFSLALARDGFDAVGALTGAAPRADAPDGMHRLSGSALTFLRWLPYILFPFTAAVAWSRRTVLPWSTFSLYEQARAKRQPHVPPPEWAVRPMHPGYLYLGVTLFSASTLATHSAAFLPLLLAALLLALWPGRNRSWRAPAWCVLVLLLGTVAAFGNRSHQLTRAAWDAMEERLMLDSSVGEGALPNTDQSGRSTSLGQLGALKQSSAIILRVTTSDGEAPGLLHEASFNRFHGTRWDVGRRDFQATELRPPPPGRATVTVTRAGGALCPLALPGDLGGLLLPRIGLLEAGGLSALRLRASQPLVVYTAAGGGGDEADTDKGYGSDDLALDHLVDHERGASTPSTGELALRSALTRIAGELALDQDDAPGSAVRLARWFDAHFTYATWQEPLPSDQGPLLNFLTTRHKGHCEYFATASVLLLRAAGIPARYAVGYSVSERDGARFLARARDAHAWTQVWDRNAVRTSPDGTTAGVQLKGRWFDLDTTPPSWFAEEDRPRGWLAGLRDLADEAWYRFTLWRQEGGRWQLAVFIAGMSVLGWIAWRQLRGSAWRRALGRGPGPASATILGLDSELAPLLPRIAARHGERLPHETVRSWLSRLRLLGQDGPPGLGEALDLHLRLRFDPAGLAGVERQALRALCARLATALAAGGDSGRGRG